MYLWYFCTYLSVRSALLTSCMFCGRAINSAGGSGWKPLFSSGHTRHTKFRDIVRHVL